MYHVSTQGIKEHIINVHYHSYDTDRNDSQLSTEAVVYPMCDILLKSIHTVLCGLQSGAFKPIMP